MKIGRTSASNIWNIIVVGIAPVLLIFFSKAIYDPGWMGAHIIIIIGKHILVLFTNGFQKITIVFILICLLQRHAVVIYSDLCASSEAHHPGPCFIDNYWLFEQYLYSPLSCFCNPSVVSEKGIDKSSGQRRWTIISLLSSYCLDLLVYILNKPGLF